MSYNPRELPDEGDVTELRQWLREELRILSKSLNETTEVDLRASRSAPTRPREGMVVHADGTAWNPGSGAGTYRFQSGLWVKIPSPSDIILPPYTNAQLADMANGTVKARGTAGTGDPEDIAVGNGITLDATSLRTKQQMSVTVDGSGLKLSGDAASPGNSQLYGTDGSGTKGWFAQPTGGGITLITSVSAPAAATWTVTGLGGYKVLWPSFRSVQQSSGTSRVLQVEISGNNGSSFSAQIHAPTNGTSFVTATPEVFNFWITRADQVNNQLLFLHSFIAPTGNNLIDTNSVGPINALRFSWSGAATNFTAGELDIYGLK